MWNFSTELITKKVVYTQRPSLLMLHVTENKTCLLIKAINATTYSLLAQYHNTPLLPQKNLHRHCFRFPLGLLHVPGAIATNDYAKFWEVKEVYYGICASREQE